MPSRLARRRATTGSTWCRSVVVAALVATVVGVASPVRAVAPHVDGGRGPLVATDVVAPDAGSTILPDAPATTSPGRAEPTVPGHDGDLPVVVDVPQGGPGPSLERSTGDGASTGEPAEAPPSTSVPVDGDPVRLHVKFRNDAEVRVLDGRLDDGPADSALDAVLAAHPDVEAEEMFPGSAQLLARGRAIAADGEAPPALDTWFLLESSSRADGLALERAFGELDVVEMVQPDPRLADTQPVDAAEEAQGYLDLAPGGIGAEWAWPRPGGTGAGVTVAVIDSGFDVSHPDLDGARGPGVVIPHEPARNTYHGTRVLGILVGDDDQQGVRGIVHDARVRIVNSGTTGADVARAIALAADALGPGDVITISQGILEGSIVLPLVYSATARDALRAAAAKGIITVVSAGNGGADLDTYESRLGPDAPATIVVGAGNPGPAAGCSSGAGARSRFSGSNHGSRVDLQGWGQCVRTTETGGGYVWWGFTSAATPIVAGAAAALSSMIEASTGVTPDGPRVRRILANTGSPQTGGGRIGPLPDLRAAVGERGPLPANDQWASAGVVDELPAIIRADATGAGIELDEPPPPCAPVSGTVWYRVDVPRAMPLSVQTQGSSFDTVLAVWRLDGRRLVSVGCNDDAGPRRNRARLRIDLPSGGAYWIQVGAPPGRSAADVVLRVTSDGPVGGGCDVTRDGLDDLVVGSPGEKLAGSERAGRVLVLPGSGGDEPATAIPVTQESPGVGGRSEPGDGFGRTVACGDVDGDGDADVLVGAPDEGRGRRTAKAGVVHLVPATTGGLATTATVSLAQDTVGAGDRSGRGERFGAALAVGDLDGDGYDDLVVGSPGERMRGRPKVGAVHVVPGSPAGPDRRRAVRVDAARLGLDSLVTGRARFGAALAVGDVDFDGDDDLVIGVPGAEVGGRRGAGAVVVVDGGPAWATSPTVTLLSQSSGRLPGRPQAGDGFGSAVAVGHLDASPRADLAIGAPGDVVDGARGGSVTVVPGRRGGVDGRGAHRVAGPTDPGGPSGFGAALAIGDVDRDGIGDLVVGTPDASTSAGAVLVVAGVRRSGAVPTLTVTLVEGDGVGGVARPGDRLGAAVAVVDLDGDGFATLAVGIPGEDVAVTENRRAVDVGRVVLVRLNPGLVAAGSVGITQGSLRSGRDEPGDLLGWSLAS